MARWMKSWEELVMVKGLVEMGVEWGDKKREEKAGEEKEEIGNQWFREHRCGRRT